MEFPRKGILLVRPRSFSGNSRPVWLQPPMNLFYLAAFLESRGFPVQVLDYEFSEYSKKGFARTLSELRPAFVGIAPSEQSLEASFDLSSVAKKTGAGVVCGGAYASIETGKTLEMTGADACIVGEAEKTLLSLLSSGKISGKIPGIVLPGSAVPRRTPALPTDLDSFGFPDRRREEFRKYDSCHSAGIGRRTAFVTASRGCPYSCTFCVSTVLHGKRWRASSVESVLCEIENCADAGYGHIQFDDDIFGLEREWFFRFCREFVEKGLHERVSWDFATRADLVDRPLLSAARRAGARKVAIGVESGSGKILSSTRKGIGKGQIIRAFRLAKRAGLMTQAFLVLGLYGETRETLKETEALLFEIDPDIPAIMLYSPIRGTLEARRFGKEASFHAGFFSRDAAPTGALLSEELVSFRDGLYRRFCLRPSYLARRLLSIRDFGELAYNAKASFAVLSGNFG